jgi:lipopolysaccharide export system protein LptA
MKYLLLIFLFFLQSDNVLRLIHASKGKYYKKENRALYVGNVHFVHDSIDLYAFKVDYYKNEERLDLFGNVKITNGKKQTIRSARGKYFGKDEIFKLYDNVRITENYLTLKSDSLYYFKKTEDVILYGKASIKDDSLHQFSKGIEIQTNRKDELVIYGDAYFFQQDDSLNIWGDTLKVNDAEKRYYANGNVRIHQKSLHATSDEAILNITDSILTFIGNPVLNYEKNEIRGDTVWLYLEKKEVKNIFVSGDGLMTSIHDSISKKMNKFEGKKLYLEMENRRPKMIRSIGNAVSVFYFEDDQGINSISADSIYIYFNEGEVENVQEFGGVQGAFYPAKYKGKVKDDY